MKTHLPDDLDLQNFPIIPRKDFKNVESSVEEADSPTQCVTLEENVKAFGMTYFGLGDKR